MADTTTTNYGLTKPEVGASEDTWGTKINTNLDTLDTTVDSIQGKSGAATLKHTDSAKLTTTATGIDVTGNATFADNGKAIFGAGSDLQVYHDGSNSYIDEAGQGTLYVRADSATTIANPSNTLSARFRPSTSVSLYYNGVEKLATTSTGIDVTGNVTMATGGSIVAGGANDLVLNAGESGTPDIYLQSGSSTKVKIEGSNGNVGIGNSSPSANLEITQSGNNVGLLVTGGSYNYTAKFESSDAEANIIIEDSNSTNDGNMIGVATNDMYFITAAAERMRIDASGNVGIGTSSPSSFFSGARQLVVGSGSGEQGITLYGGSAHTSYLLFADGTSGAATYAGQVNYNHATNALNFCTNGITTPRMTIDSSGNVLVGSDVLPNIDAGFTGHSDLGDPAKRFEDAYVRDGVTTGSDGRDKQDIEALSDAEQRVAVACKGLLRKWRWIDSVEAKGEDARIHFGIIAQDLQAAFEAEGLDAGRYAMFINSTWTDEETGQERSRMGVRYSELLAFIIAAI